MTSITFFFILIPILALVLLAVNFIFAPHAPYQEKNSVFECGFHSFLGQNRTQFSISFFIFALLFLLFDLEILLMYPYAVSANLNSIYGLSFMLIFFLMLTLGFAFELGKNALKIESRQFNEGVVIPQKMLHYKQPSSNELLESNIFNSSYITFIFTLFTVLLSSMGFENIEEILQSISTLIHILSLPDLESVLKYI